MGELFIVVLIVAVIVLFILFSAIKIVREYERLVVFRLGRAIGVRGPGFVLLIPIVERIESTFESKSCPLGARTRSRRTT